MNDTHRDMNGKDRKTEDTNERRCAQFGIRYNPPELGEMPEETESRRDDMTKMIANERKRKQREKEMPEKKKSRQEADRIGMQVARREETAEKKKSRQEADKYSKHVAWREETT